MNEPPPEEQELSAEDYAILEAFNAMEEWDPASSKPSLFPETSSAPQQNTNEGFLEDIFSVFFSEAEEDIATMRQALHQLEQGEGIDPARLTSLRHVAHKIHGSAGMMSYPALATIAHFIERIVDATTSGKIAPLLSVNALVQAVFALEMTLNDIIRTRTENDTPRRELEAYLQKLALDLQEPIFVQVDTHRLEQLTHHTEQLAALHTPLGQAQRQVETALQELQAAQIQWQHLETELTGLLSVLESPQSKYDIHPISFHIAQLLREAAQRNEVFHPRKIRLYTRLIKSKAEPPQDKPDTERDMLIRTLKETHMNLTAASAHVLTTFAQFSSVLQEYMAQVDTVRNDMRLLHSASTNA